MWEKKRQFYTFKIPSKQVLNILSLQVIGISSAPVNETVIYPNGDQIQYFTIEFYSNHWEGNLQADLIETKKVFFRSPDFQNKLPQNEQSTFESLSYFRNYGKIRLR